MPGKAGLSAPDDGVADTVAQQSCGPGAGELARRFAWPALLRTLDRIDPDFRQQLSRRWR